MSADPLELHHLTASSPELSGLLPEIVQLSNSIFAADPQSKYASIDEWTSRLASPGSIILYLSPSTRPGRPAAFLFAHRRPHASPLTLSETESLHVWLAGVCPERRREGCLAWMIDALGSPSVLTVCTTPSACPDMWAWLTRRAWSVERELDGGKIMLSKRARAVAGQAVERGA